MKDFDELLDEVLREDAAAESRAGLELRVMARVRGERRGGFGFGLGSRGWGWLVPAVVCAGIVAAMWLVPRRERVCGAGVSLLLPLLLFPRRRLLVCG